MNNIFDKLNKDLRQEFMKVMTSQQKLSKLKYRERENKWEKKNTEKPRISKFCQTVSNSLTVFGLPH